MQVEKEWAKLISSTHFQFFALLHFSIIGALFRIFTKNNLSIYDFVSTSTQNNHTYTHIIFRTRVKFSSWMKRNINVITPLEKLIAIILAKYFWIKMAWGYLRLIPIWDVQTVNSCIFFLIDVPSATWLQQYVRIIKWIWKSTG